MYRFTALLSESVALCTGGCESSIRAIWEWQFRLVKTFRAGVVRFPFLGGASELKNILRRALIDARL